jgi:hypothetical protein
MKKHAKRMGVLFVEALALMLALIAGFLFYAHWKVSNGGLSVSIFKGRLASVLEERLSDGSDVELGNVVLSRVTDEEGTKGGPLRIIIDDIHVRNSEGASLLDLPSVSFRMSTSDILNGQMRPRYVEIREASLSVTRTEDGTFDFGFSRNGEGPRPMTNLLTERQGHLDAEELFEGALLSQTSLRFTDRMTGKKWSADNVQAEVWQVENGYAASLSAPFQVDGHEVDLEVEASIDDTTGEILIDTKTASAPVRDLLTLIAGEEISQLIKTDISGSVKTIAAYDGTVKKAVFDVTAGEGYLILNGEKTPMQGAMLKADFTPSDRTFHIDQFTYDFEALKGNWAGRVSLGAIGEDGRMTPESVEFDMTGSDLVIDVPGALPEALPLSSAAFAGDFNLVNRILSFDAINIDYFEQVFAGNLAIEMPEQGQSPGIAGAIKLDGAITPAQLLRGWPIPLADGARRWVDDNIKSGRISNIDFKIDLAPGAIKAGEPLANEALTLTFDFSNLTSTYVQKMTPLTALRGSGKLQGNRFDLSVTQGRLKDNVITGGRVLMPGFVPKGQDAVFSVSVEGQVPDILSVVNEEPLQYITKAGFTPEDFGGTGSFDFEIVRPMRSYVPQEDYRFKGTGQYTDISIDGLFRDYDLTEGNGTLSLNEKGMSLAGKALFEQAPANFTWSRTFDDDAIVSIEADGLVSARTADNFGVSVRQYLRGDVGYKFSLKKRNELFDPVNIALDLKEADVTLGDINWTKARGRDGQVDIVVTPPQENDENGTWDFSKILMTASDLELRANTSFSEEWQLLSADIDRLFIEKRADINGFIRREDDLLRAVVQGPYANLDVFIDGLMKGPGTGDEDSGDDGSGAAVPGAAELDMKVDRLDLKKGVSLAGFDARMHYNGDDLVDLSVSGDINVGGAFVARVAEDETLNIGRNLTVETDNLGAMTRGVFGITSINGGKAAYKATMLTNGPLAGTLSASDFRVKDAPLVARFLSAGSLTALGDLLNGEGIEFNSVTADLQVDEGVMSIVDARATGPAVGVSVKGDVDFVLNVFDLDGAFAPAYQVNSVLGQLPGLGELLISRQGEGIVAFSYNLRGPISDPTATVNTLSLFTPGIFRRIFEPLRTSRPTTAELLEQAVEAAEMSDQREFTTTAEQLRELEDTLDTFVPKLEELEEDSQIN